MIARCEGSFLGKRATSPWGIPGLEKWQPGSPGRHTRQRQKYTVSLRGLAPVACPMSASSNTGAGRGAGIRRVQLSMDALATVKKHSRIDPKRGARPAATPRSSRPARTGTTSGSTTPSSMSPAWATPRHRLLDVFIKEPILTTGTRYRRRHLFRRREGTGVGRCRWRSRSRRWWRRGVRR
jgi:hypothetical protein